MQSHPHEDSNPPRGELAGSRRFGRRDALRVGGVAAAAIGAGTVLLRPQAAGATTGAMQFGHENDSGGDSTGLSSANPGDSLHISNSAGAPALRLRSGGAALVATGNDAGVLAVTNGTGAALHGVANVGTGPAVRGEIGGEAATVAAIEALQNGHGNGVSSPIDNAASTASAVRALTRGTEPSIWSRSALERWRSRSGTLCGCQ